MYPSAVPQPSVQQFLSLCPVCQHQIDVTEQEPFAKIPCPECKHLVRVRRNFDHFRIVRQIGEGGMSRVFEAEDEELGRRVALKILNRTYSLDEKRIEQFKREARITARLSHLNVIKLYTTGEDHGYFYIAMELVSGGSLEQRIKEQGRLEETDALRIGREVAEGLRAGERDGLIHRDVKPANILFTDTGTAKVVDFGLALFAGTDDDSDEIWATPYYVAPEKILENEEDYRSDIFSLGATLYHALIGEPPHKVDSVSMDEMQKVKQKPVLLEESGTRFSPHTVAVVNRMTELNPVKRPQGYESVVDDLRVAERLSKGRLARIGRRRLAFIIGSSVAIIAAFLFGWMARSSGEKAATVINTVSQADVRALEQSGATVVQGQASISDRFRTARDQIQRQEFARARGAFNALIKEGLRQPTLSWARFHLAVCATAQGDRAMANRVFRLMADDPSADTDLRGEPSAFFPSLGSDLIAKPAERIPPADASYRKDNEEILGYLLRGLAEWHFGDPALGVASLQTAVESLPLLEGGTAFASGVLDWIPDYIRAFNRRYGPDMEAALYLASLTEPSDLIATQAQMDQLREMKRGLKTGGQLPTRIDNRLADLQRQVTRIQLADQTAELEERRERRRRELVQFEELAALLPSLVHGYDYHQALDVLSGVRFDTREVRDAAEAQRYLYRQADNFLAGLERDVALSGWEGTVQRVDGATVEGRVESLNRDEIQLSLDVGTITLPLDQIAPVTLVQMAQSFLTGVTDSTEYYDRMEQATVFARVAGLHSLSSMLAAPLMEENREFRMRWLKVL